MIVYDKLWDVLKQKGISQNKLYKQYGISRAQIYRLKHNQVVYTSTLDMMCEILECSDISDIATYIPNDRQISGS
ncbi:MAG: helix-turn-helix transcriptional regulator [Lachnospiraceae bacterium]|nr:helix-turn-helix transcriptional regulator [Lachnospiraceae bacterium]